VVPQPGSGTGHSAEAVLAMTLAVTLAGLAVIGTGLVGHVVEERGRLSAESRLLHIALHDELTGLPNRRRFGEALAERCAALADGGPPFALLIVDLDRFKAVNDTLGHPAGDVVLRRAAERLAIAAQGRGALLARIGGDEFAILVDRPHEVEILARNVVELLCRPFLVGGNVADIGASIGIARAPADGTTPEGLNQNADLALYGAKAKGRNGYAIFEPAMAEETLLRRSLETDLRRAVAKEEFEVVYQPLVDARSGAFTGAEALVRWRHPTRGVISPVTFIPLAEELGLVGRIGDFVLRRACEDAATWPEHLGVSVNLAAAQIVHPRLQRTVTEALSAAGLAPSRLEIEITETTLLSNDALVTAALLRLSATGIRIALDDFGTGYSSLSYLHRFPIHRIKIDRSFVQRLPEDQGSASIVRAIALLGHSLGMTVTAEGVETEAQRDWVAAQGCDRLQGFYFSRPVSSVDIARVWSAQPADAAA
jgi:diguanylate cyclase